MRGTAGNRGDVEHHTHPGLEDAADELDRLNNLEAAQKELNKTSDEKKVTQSMFRVI